MSAREVFQPTEYQLVSVASGTRRPDEDGWTLGFPEEPDSLIRADYKHKQLTLRNDLDGLYRFADWLPIRRTLVGSAAPVTYRSEELAAALGLTNLWITFNGWWPERAALMKTGSFKECEAYSVCARLPENFDKVLVVASAGNTARAFARVCSDNRIPLLLCIPEDNLDAMWFDRRGNDATPPIAASNPFTALLRRAGWKEAALPVDLRVRPWYNPDLRTATFIIPGLIAIILTFTLIPFTAIAIVRERERGTLEQLQVPPVTRLEIILGSASSS